MCWSIKTTPLRICPDFGRLVVGRVFLVLGRHADIFHRPLELTTGMTVGCCSPLDDHSSRLGIDRPPSASAAVPP